MAGDIRIPIRVTVPFAGPMKGVISSCICYSAVVKVFNLAEWEVQKTFDEYVSLRKTLELGLGCRLAALPPTFWFGNADPEVIEERRLSIEKFTTEALEMCLHHECGLRAEALWNFLRVPHSVRQVIYFLSCPELRHSKLVKLRELLPDDGSVDSSTPALCHTSVLEALLDMASVELSQDVGKALLETVTWQLEHGSDWRVLFDMDGLNTVLDMGIARDGRDVSKSTAAALKTLLVIVGPHQWREAVPWSQPLADRLRALLTSPSIALQESIASVLWATCGSSDEAARQFMYSAVSSDRKTLMNALFTSSSPTVKAFAGILFARLLPFLERNDGYVVSQKTEDGLGHLLSDLCNLEEEGWKKEPLFALHPWRECVAELLLSPSRPARTFALFVLKKSGDGQGLRQYLAESLQQGSETMEERAALSELLLSAWRDDFEHGSDEDVMRISTSLSDESHFVIESRKKRLQSLRDYRSKQESTRDALIQHFSSLSLPTMQNVADSFQNQQAALAQLHDMLCDAGDSLQAAEECAERQTADIAETASLSSQLPRIWTDATELLRRRNTTREALEEMNAGIEHHEKVLEAIGSERIEAEKERLLLSQEGHKRHGIIEHLEERARQARHYAYAVLPEMRTAIDRKKRDVEEKLQESDAGSSAYRQWKRELSSLQQECFSLKNPEDLEVEAKLAEEESMLLKEQHAASERAIATLGTRTRKIDAELEEASKPLPEFRQRRAEMQASHDEVARMWDDVMQPHVQKEHTYFLDRWERTLKNVRDNGAVDSAADAVLCVDNQFVEEHATRQELKRHCLTLIDELQKVVNLLD